MTRCRHLGARAMVRESESVVRAMQKVKVEPEVSATFIRRGDNKFSNQAVVDLVEAIAGAGFVLFTARRAADANGANRVITNVDRQTALHRHELSVVEGGIERTRCGDRFSEIPGRDPSDGGRVCFAAGQGPGGQARAVTGEKHPGDARAVHERDRYVVALSLTARDPPLCWLNRHTE